MMHPAQVTTPAPDSDINRGRSAVHSVEKAHSISVVQVLMGANCTEKADIYSLGERFTFADNPAQVLTSARRYPSDNHLGQKIPIWVRNISWEVHSVQQGCM